MAIKLEWAIYVYQSKQNFVKSSVFQFEEHTTNTFLNTSRRSSRIIVKKTNVYPC